MNQRTKYKTENIITKYSALFFYLGGGFPKQPMNPRGRDGTGRLARLCPVLSLQLPFSGYVAFGKFLNLLVAPLPNL